MISRISRCTGTNEITNLKGDNYMKVRFSVGMNMQGADFEEVFSLEDLGIDENQSPEELEKDLGEAYNEWAWEHLTGGFELEEDSE